ncbi:MAG TPA: hypothetical protein VF337_11370, partial [Candidatus Limnocylindrales bacterium]
MAKTDSSPSQSAHRFRVAKSDLLFAVAVAAVYAMATALAIGIDKAGPDQMTLVAEGALRGYLHADGLKGGVDVVLLGGHYYLALGVLQLLPYLPFAAIPSLQGIGHFATGLLFGAPAACLSLPLARAYGAKGADAFWIAAFTAFGSLLFYVSVLGDMYYLAHAESFLALTLFLLEWAGRRRPAVLGAALAVSFLARPTTLIAAVPCGLALLWSRRIQVRSAAVAAITFGLPIAVALAVFGWFNWVRFGSPLESGYAISYINHPSLVDRRAMGLFSIRQIPENLRLALFALPGVVNIAPFFVPDREG